MSFFSSILAPGGMLNNMWDLNAMQERQEAVSEGEPMELATFRSSLAAEDDEGEPQHKFQSIVSQ